MWDAWTSSGASGSSPSSTSRSAGATHNVKVVVSSPAVSASSSSSSLGPPSALVLPQLSLLTIFSRKITRRLSSCSSSKVLHMAVTAAAVAGAALAFALAAQRLRPRNRANDDRSGCGPTAAPAQMGSEGPQLDDRNASFAASRAAARVSHNDDGDPIVFTDPAESAFLAYVNRLRRQKEAPLLATIAKLEAAAVELAAMQHSKANGDCRGGTCETADDDGRVCNITASGPQVASVSHHAITQAQALVHRLAIVADELLTQYICSLDGAPVRQSAELKQRRKTLIQEAAVLSRRISPHLSSLRV